MENIEKERAQKAQQIALHIWKLAKDEILIHLRFLNAALSELSLRADFGMEGISCDGSAIYYNPLDVIARYKKEPMQITRCYLHILLHCIFNHAFRYEKMDKHLWDIASDMAVEHAVLEMDIKRFHVNRDDVREKELAVWKKKVNALTAERMYHFCKENPMYTEELDKLAALFQRDMHVRWEKPVNYEISQAQWQKISERIKTELKAFSQEKTEKKQGIMQNLEEATREHYDYGEFLKKFCVAGEEMTVNDDEFDYVYYTYGLKLYGNLPLVEPLEYKDVNKIKEFVVAIDTSASCRGEIVQTFLRKTYDILKSSENFFRKVNIHIIQCDSRVQSDTKITCDEDFELFMKKGKLEGFGSTDFRPVFKYVNACIEKKEFENLKGLIYFTDGYGVFPQQKPSYETAFVFLDDDYEQPQIPSWAIKLVLSKDDISEMEDDYEH